MARKGVKAYMVDPQYVEVKSITTDHVQRLYLAEDDYHQLNGKRVLIVDDVISTGESLAALEVLVNKFGGNIVAALRCWPKAMPKTVQIFCIWNRCRCSLSKRQT